MSKLYSIDWGYEEEKLSVWNGKKMTHKMPKVEAGDVILTENMPNKLAKPLIKDGAIVMRCSPNSSAAYREKYNIPKTDDNDAIVIWDLYKDSPAKFRQMKEDSKLKQFYVNYEQLTKQITAVKNRQWAAEDDDNKEYLASLEKAKDLLAKKLTKELKRIPIYDTFLSKIKGIGPALAAGLISEIGEIKRFDNVSNLYAYAGVHIKDNKALKKQKGVVANWNSALRCLVCHGVPDQFVRQKSPIYNGIYADEKARCAKIFEEDSGKAREDRRVQSLLHAERRARRKAGKIFLHHLWKAWRELEGLPVPKPWVLEHGGHSKEILPPTAYPGLT
jgi:hypothetical protein